MSQPQITVYFTEWCPYCRRARNLLTGKGATLHEINVEDDAKFREEMIARSGRRTVPQIFIGEQHVGGCDDVFALEESGELDRLLRGAE